MYKAVVNLSESTALIMFIKPWVFKLMAFLIIKKTYIFSGSLFIYKDGTINHERNQ